MEEARIVYHPPPLPHPITLLDNYELAELVKAISSPRASETAMYIRLKGISGRTFLDFKEQDLQTLSQGDGDVLRGLTQLQEVPPKFLDFLRLHSPRSLAAQFNSLRDVIHPQRNRPETAQMGTSRQDATQDGVSFLATGEPEEDVIFDFELDLEEEEGPHPDADFEGGEQDASSYRGASPSVENFATTPEASETSLVHLAPELRSEDELSRPSHLNDTLPLKQRAALDNLTALQMEDYLGSFSGHSALPSIISNEMSSQPVAFGNSLQDASLPFLVGEREAGNNDAEANSSDDGLSYCSSQPEFPLFPGAFRIHSASQGPHDAACGPSNHNPISSPLQSQNDGESVPSRDLLSSSYSPSPLPLDPPASSTSASISTSAIMHRIPGTSSEINVPLTHHGHDIGSDIPHNGLQGQHCGNLDEPGSMNTGGPDGTSSSESTSSSPSSSIEKEGLEGSGLICHRDMSEIESPKPPTLSSMIHDGGSGYGSGSPAGPLGAQAQASDSTTTLPLPSSVLTSPKTPVQGLENDMARSANPECTHRLRAGIIQAAFALGVDETSIADNLPMNDVGRLYSSQSILSWSEGGNVYPQDVVYAVGVASMSPAACLGPGRPEYQGTSTLGHTLPSILSDTHVDIRTSSSTRQEQPCRSPILQTPLPEVTIDQTPFQTPLQTPSQHHFILPSTDSGADRPLEHELPLLSALWASGALDRLTIAPDERSPPRDTMPSSSFTELVGSQVGSEAAASSIAGDKPQTAYRNDGDSRLLGGTTEMNEQDLLQIDTPHTSGNPPTIVPLSPYNLSGPTLGTSGAQMTGDFVASAETSDNPETQTSTDCEDINAQPNCSTLLDLPAKVSSSSFSSLSDGSTIFSSPRAKLLCLVPDVQASSFLGATPDDGKLGLLAFVENANYTFFNAHGASMSVRTDGLNDGCISHDNFLTSLLPPESNTSNAELTSGTSATGAEGTNVISTCAPVHPLETSLLMTNQPPGLPHGLRYGSGSDPTPMLDVLPQDVPVIPLLACQPVDLEPGNDAEGHPDFCRTHGERTGDGNISSYESTLPLIPLSPSGSFFEEFPPSLCDLDYFRDDALDASLITPRAANLIPASRTRQNIPRPSIPPVAESYFEDGIQARVSSWQNLEAFGIRSTTDGVQKPDLPVSHLDVSVQTDVQHQPFISSQQLESNTSADSSPSLSVRLRENGLLREIIDMIPNVFSGKYAAV